MQLISKFDKGIKFLLCVIDLLSKYSWVPLKDKKEVPIVNAFQKILVNLMELHSNKTTNKIWIDKGSEFYNRSIKSCLAKNGIETCSTKNEGKSVVAKRFIRTSKNKIYKNMTSILKCIYW